MERFYRKVPSRNDMFLACLTAPLYAAAVSRYGLKLLVALLVSVAVGSLTELVTCRIRNRKTELFGYPYWMLIPLVLPPTFPLWMTGAATFFGTLIGTSFFGGHGRQLVSPVAVAWTFSALSFPAAFGFGWSLPFSAVSRGFSNYTASVLTIDHPVTFLAAKGGIPLADILPGYFPQPPGNAIPFVLLACGLLLLLLRVVDIRVVVSFLGTVFALTALADHLAPGSFPAIHGLFVGNLLLAGFFIFPDTRVAPRTWGGRWITGILAGIIAFLIRSYSTFPDGVFFAVLFGNTFSAIIDEGVLAFKYRRTGS